MTNNHSSHHFSICLTVVFDITIADCVSLVRFRHAVYLCHVINNSEGRLFKQLLQIYFLKTTITIQVENISDSLNYQGILSTERTFTALFPLTSVQK